MSDWRNKPINSPYIDGDGNYSIVLHYQSQYDIDMAAAETPNVETAMGPFWTWQHKKELATYAFTWVARYFGRVPSSVPKEIILLANGREDVSSPTDITGLEIVGQTEWITSASKQFPFGANPFRDYFNATTPVSRDATRVVSITDPTMHIRASGGDLDFVDAKIYAFKVTFLKEFIESLKIVTTSRHLHENLRNANKFAVRFSVKDAINNESGPILSVINKPVIQFTESMIGDMYNALAQAIQESIPLPTLEEVAAISATIATGISPSAEGLYYDPVTQDYFLVPSDRLVDWIVYEQLIRDFIKQNKSKPIPPSPAEKGLQYREIAFGSYKSFVNSMGELEALLMDFNKELLKSEYEYYDDIPAGNGVPHAGAGQPAVVGTGGVYNAPEGYVLDLEEESKKIKNLKTKMDRFFKLNEESFKGTFKDPDDLGLGDLYKNVNKRIIFGFELTQVPYNLFEPAGSLSSNAPIPQLRYVRTETIAMKQLQEEIAYRESDVKQRVNILKNILIESELAKARNQITKLRGELTDYKLKYHAELMKSMMFLNIFPFDIGVPTFYTVPTATEEEKAAHFNPDNLILPPMTDSVSRPIADENTLVPGWFSEGAYSATVGTTSHNLPGFDPYRLNKFKISHLRTFFILYNINQIASEPAIIDRIESACGFPAPGLLNTVDSHSTLAQRVKSASGKSASSPTNKDDKLTADVFIKKYMYSSRYTVQNPGTPAAVVKTLPMNWRLKKVLSDEQIRRINAAKAESTTKPMTLDEVNRDDEWYKRIDVKKVLAKTNKTAADEIGDQLFSALPRKPREIGEVDSITDLFLLVLNKTDIQTIAKEVMACMYLNYSLQDLVEMLCDELLEKAFAPFDGLESAITKIAEEIGLDKVGFSPGKVPEQTFVNFMRAFRSYQVKVSVLGATVEVADGGMLYTKMEILFGNWTKKRIDEITGTSFYSTHRDRFDINEKLFLCEALVYGAIELVNTLIQVFKWAWDYLNGSPDARFERDKIPAKPKCDINFRLPDHLPYLGKMLKELEKELFKTLVEKAEKVITEQVISHILAWLENCGSSGPQRAGELNAASFGLDTSTAKVAFPTLGNPEDYLNSLFTLFTPGELCQLFQDTATSKLMQDVDIFNRLRFTVEIYDEYPGIEGVRQLFIDLNGVLDTSVCEFLEDPPCIDDLCEDIEQSLRERKIRASLQRQGFSEEQIELQIAKDRMLQQATLANVIGSATDPVKTLKDQTNSSMNKAISKTPFLQFAGNVATKTIIQPVENAVVLDLNNYVAIINQYFQEKFEEAQTADPGEVLIFDASEATLHSLDPGDVITELTVYTDDDAFTLPDQPENPFTTVKLGALPNESFAAMNLLSGLPEEGGAGIKIVLPPEITGEAGDKIYRIKWVPLQDNIGILEADLDENTLKVAILTANDDNPHVPLNLTLPGQSAELWFSRRIAEGIAHSGGASEPDDPTDVDINGDPTNLQGMKNFGWFNYSSGFDLGKYIKATSLGPDLLLELKESDVAESVLEDIEILFKAISTGDPPLFLSEFSTMGTDPLTVPAPEDWGKKPEHSINIGSIWWADQQGNNSFISDGVYDPAGTDWQSEGNKGGVYGDMETVLGFQPTVGGATTYVWFDESVCAEYSLLSKHLEKRLDDDFPLIGLWGPTEPLKWTDFDKPPEEQTKAGVDDFLDVENLARLWSAMKRGSLESVVRLATDKFTNLQQYQTIDLSNSELFPFEKLQEMSKSAVNIYLQKTDFTDPDSNPSAIGDATQETLIYCALALILIEMIITAPGFSSEISLEQVLKEKQIMPQFFKAIFDDEDLISEFNQRIFEKYAIKDRITVDTIAETLTKGLDQKVGKVLGVQIPEDSAPNSLLKIYDSRKGNIVMDAPTRNTRLIRPAANWEWADEGFDVTWNDFNIKSKVSRLWAENVDADKIEDRGQFWHAISDVNSMTMGIVQYGWSTQWFEFKEGIADSINNTYEKLFGSDIGSGQFIFETYAKVPTEWLTGNFPGYSDLFPAHAPYSSIYGKKHAAVDVPTPQTEKTIVGFPEFKRIILGKLKQAVEAKVGGVFNESDWSFENETEGTQWWPGHPYPANETDEVLMPYETAWFTDEKFAITNIIDGKKKWSKPRPFFYAAPFVWDIETDMHAGFISNPDTAYNPYQAEFNGPGAVTGLSEWNIAPYNPETGQEAGSVHMGPIFDSRLIIHAGLYTDDLENLKDSIKHLYTRQDDAIYNVPTGVINPKGDVLPIAGCKIGGEIIGEAIKYGSIKYGFWKTNFTPMARYTSPVMYGFLTTFERGGANSSWDNFHQQDKDSTKSGWVTDARPGSYGSIFESQISHWIKIDSEETRTFRFRDRDHPSLAFYFNEDCGIKSLKPEYKIVESSIRVPSIVKTVIGKKVRLHRAKDSGLPLANGLDDIQGLTMKMIEDAGIRWPGYPLHNDVWFANVGGQYVWDGYNEEIVIVETQPIKIYKIYHVRKVNKGLNEQKAIQYLGLHQDDPSPVLSDDFLNDVEFGVRLSYALSDDQIINNNTLSEAENLFRYFVLNPYLKEGASTSLSNAEAKLMENLESTKSYNFVLKEPSDYELVVDQDKALQEKVDENLWQHWTWRSVVRTIPLASVELLDSENDTRPRGDIFRALDYYPLSIGEVTTAEMMKDPFLSRGWGDQTFSDLMKELKETDDFKHVVEDIFEIKTGAAIILLAMMGEFSRQFADSPETVEAFLETTKGYLDTMTKYIQKYPYGKTELDDEDLK